MVIIDRVFTLYRCCWYWCGRLCRLLLLETMLACLPHLICFRLIALHPFPRLALRRVRWAWLHADLFDIHRICWRRLIGISDIAVRID